jgi:hypothetical protein
MLISRFMLNLRHEASSLHAQNTVRLPTMRFSDRIIGNMGQPLRFGLEDDDVEDNYCGDREPADNMEYSREVLMVTSRVCIILRNSLLGRC